MSLFSGTHFKVCRCVFQALSHIDHQLETVNYWIIWSHQYGLPVGLGSCSQEWQHCLAGAGCSLGCFTLHPLPNWAQSPLPLMPPGCMRPQKKFQRHKQQIEVWGNLFKTCSNVFQCVQMCSNLFKTCSNVFEHVQTFSKLVQMCSNMFKPLQNLFKCVQTCS